MTLKAKLLVIFALYLIGTPTFAQAPKLINYQGHLVENGQPASGIRDLTFTIYDSPSGGNTLFQEEHRNVQILEGVFRVLLGSKKNMANQIFSGTDRYLGVKVGGQAELSPRFQFTSVAFAMKANIADTAKTLLNLFVNEGGDVGIGTTAPVYTTEIIGSLAISGNEFGNFKDGETNARIFVDASASVGHVLMYLGNNDVDAVTVLGNGNVGIGTTSPGVNLHVLGHAKIEGDSTGFSLVTPAEGGVVPYLQFRDQSSEKDWVLKHEDDSFHIMDEVSGDQNKFFTVAGSGNVGIGTTTPSDKLEVNGNIRTAAGVVAGTFFTFDRESGSGNIRKDSTGIPLHFRNSAGTPEMTIDDSGNVGIGIENPAQRLHVEGNIFSSGIITGIINDISSREYKMDIENLSLDEAVSTLQELNPVKFKYKEEKSQDSHVGFIAEDVPKLVATPDRKGLSPMDFVAVLTKVVQEQQKTITALKERVQTLESSN